MHKILFLTTAMALFKAGRRTGQSGFLKSSIIYLNMFSPAPRHCVYVTLGIQLHNLTVLRQNDSISSCCWRAAASAGAGRQPVFTFSIPFTARWRPPPIDFTSLHWKWAELPILVLLTIFDDRCRSLLAAPPTNRPITLQPCPQH